MAGYIKLHRGWRNNPIFGREYSRGDAWIWLLENAAWKPARIKIKGKVLTLERGELSFSQRFLAEAWSWSKSRVDRFLAELREEGMIQTRSKNGATAGHKAGQGQSILTICNYTKYQDNEDVVRGNDGPESGATAGQQRGKEEEGKEGKERNITREADCPASVSGDVWGDVIRLRRAQKAPLTPTALARIEGEARKARWDLEDALAEMTMRGWRGFKADWVKADRDSRIVVGV